MNKYFPTIASTLVLLLLSFRNLVADGGFTVEDRYVLGIAAVNIFITWWTPNLSGAVLRYAKLAANAALVGLAFYMKAQVGDGDMSFPEWVDGIVLVAGALGIALVPGPVNARFEDGQPALRR